MRRLGVILAFPLVSGSVLGQQQTCERNEFGEFEEIACAVTAAEAADRELNAAYAQLLGVLGPEEADALRQAQRAWLQFLKADADFVIAREGDGSSGELIIVNNRERLTRARTTELRSSVPR